MKSSFWVEPAIGMFYRIGYDMGKKSKIIHWADETTPIRVKLLVNNPLERTDSKVINFAPLAMIEHEEERK